MPRRSPPTGAPSRDGALSPLVSVVLLVFLTGLVAAGVHLWLGTFSVGGPSETPDGDVVFRSCAASEDQVEVSLRSGGPLAFQDLGVELLNVTSATTEVSMSGVPLGGGWTPENPNGGTLTFGSRDTRMGGVPWGLNNSLPTPGGLAPWATYELRFDHEPSGDRVDTVGFSCR